MNTNKPISFVFFGTSEFSVHVLVALQEKGLMPTHIVTAPDAPQGRKLLITPPPVKTWAITHNVPFIQPETLKDSGSGTASESLIQTLRGFKADVFVVASYGKIVPQTILDIPPHKTLNVHPSLLPKLRGASPIQMAILEEETTGVTIMRLDDQMDHGPIVAQQAIGPQEIAPNNWPPRYDILEHLLGALGGMLLADTLPAWIAGDIAEQEQDHTQATYTKKIEKEDGLISLDDTPQKNLRKIRAFSEWPRAYFFTKRDEKDTRVIITDAHIVTDESGTEKLEILRVIPEGKKEMNYRDFLNG